VQPEPGSTTTPAAARLCLPPHLLQQLPPWPQAALRHSAAGLSGLSTLRHLRPSWRVLASSLAHPPFWACLEPGHLLGTLLAAVQVSQGGGWRRAHTVIWVELLRACLLWVR
jgi:hypothetical protein